ncbi:MAG TPA: MlaD family protein [Rhodocyclaceae bacterium]
MTTHSEDPRVPPRPLAVTRFRSPVSWIWLVPAVAVLVALGLAIHAVLARGPEITVRFASAEGLEANKTKIRYKDVAIGTVTAIALSDDRHSVKVTAAMDKQAEPLLVGDSRFWVVRPRVGSGGISGLGTLLSGPYIAVDPGRASAARDDFTGLDAPPLVVNDMPGRQFTLAADDLGSIDVGAPVYFRRVPVGRVVGYSMQGDGRSVNIRIFVDAPFDRFVTSSARFWHAGGIDVSLDANGMKMEMQSLASLAMGGIAFSGPDVDGEIVAEEAPAEARFTLFSDHAAALRVPDSVVQKYVLVFKESVRGLTVGAPVDFRGLSAGEVSRIDLDLSPGASEAAIAVEINLYPERLARLRRKGPAHPESAAAMRKIIDGLVASGLRAQVRVGNLLTGQSYVALDFFQNAKPGKVKWDRTVPELPTQAGSIDSLQQQLQHLMDTLQKTVERADHLIAGVDGQLVPELTATLRDARKTLNEAGGTLASESPTQIELRDTLREVGRAAAAVRNVADLLDRQPESLLTGRKASQ